MPFQSTVNTYPAAAAPGARAGLNPMAYLLPVPVAEENGVTVGSAVWPGDTAGSVSNVAPESAATAAQLIGGPVTLSSLTSITDGALKISVDSTERALSSLNFTTASTLGDVATILQQAIVSAGSTGTTVTATEDALIITSPTTGTSSAVSYASSPSAGTDVSALLGLTQASGASQVAGANASVPAPLGIVRRELTGQIEGTEEAVNGIAPGRPVPVVQRGDLYVVPTSSVARGQKVFASATDGSLVGGSAGATISGYVETDWEVRQDATAGNPVLISNWR